MCNLYQNILNNFYDALEFYTKLQPKKKNGPKRIVKYL